MNLEDIYFPYPTTPELVLRFFDHELLGPLLIQRAVDEGHAEAVIAAFCAKLPEDNDK